MSDVAAGLREVTARFSGVVSVSRGADVLVERAYGLADRAHGVPVTIDTRFGLASVTKGFTALAVVSLVVEGRLALSTPARSVLGDDLPLVGDEVTVEHLLRHTSGIGDYVDEELDTPEEEYVLTVPVHTLATTDGYLAELDGRSPKFAPGERFSYCNSGYVLLALIAERVSGLGFHELVAERVFAPAGMAHTAFLRSDDLPGDAALGYLADGRTNVLHVPVRGSGDGGAYSTAADLRRFWAALFGGRIVGLDVLEEMIDNSANPDYGLGFWRSGPRVQLAGGDVGVSAWTVHDPEAGLTYSVLANTAAAAGPVKRHLDTLLW